MNFLKKFIDTSLLILDLKILDRSILESRYFSNHRDFLHVRPYTYNENIIHTYIYSEKLAPNDRYLVVDTRYLLKRKLIFDAPYFFESMPVSPIQVSLIDTCTANLLGKKLRENPASN